MHARNYIKVVPPELRQRQAISEYGLLEGFERHCSRVPLRREREDQTGSVVPSTSTNLLREPYG